MDTTYRPDQAQAGDELNRQVDQGFASYLADQRAQLSRTQGNQASFNQNYGPTGTMGKAVSGLADVSNLPTGVNPLQALQPYNSALAQQASYQSGLNTQASTASNNILQTLAAMSSSSQEQELKNLEIGAKKAELLGKGYKLDGNTLVPLTDKEKESAGFVSENAIAEVIRQGGRDFIKGGSAAERQMIAEDILRAGGVAEYRKMLPLKDLLNSTELKDLDTQTDLDLYLQQGINAFENAKPLTGTGPLAALIPGFISGETTRDLRRQVESIKAQYARMLSGAVISDKEMKRLSQFLPSSSKTETQNLEDMRKLSNDIKINQEIFELGKKDGLTANEAFAKYGEQVFSKYGSSSSKRPSLDSFVSGDK